MSEPLKGKLRWTADKGKPRVWRLAWISRNGRPQPEMSPDRGTLAADLINTADNDIEVEYEYGLTGRPINIHRAGTAWVAVAANASPAPSANAKSVSGASGRREGHFHNPYNFIPAVPLPSADLLAETDLGPRRPIGHRAWYSDHFTGRITVEIEVKTPLIVPDSSRAWKTGKGHLVVPLLTEGNDGRTPKLPPTSFKGALRTAYEAITNSRLGIFHKHDRPLGRRMEAGEGLAMVPARISEDGGIELWMGTLAPTHETEYQKNRPQADRRPPTGVMYAAWLPQYDRRGSSKRGPFYDRNAIQIDGQPPKHGEPVVCWLRKAQKINRNSGNPIFSYWRVVEMRCGHDLSALPPETALGNPQAEFGNSHRYDSAEKPIQARGYVCITNQNIGRKHDERVFFVPGTAKPYRPAADELDIDEWSTAWEHLIADYKEKAEKIVALRQKEGVELDTYEGASIGETALSRHICDPSAAKLKGGDLCYANISADGRITGLYPVMISREVAKLAPLDLLGEGLAQAETIEELSPADRVFGWVNQGSRRTWKGEKRAYKGQLRIASVRYLGCRDDEGREGSGATNFPGEGLPLAILSMPKPEQTRFYVAKDKQGVPQDDGIGKLTAAYDQGLTAAGLQNKGLRGRKVYPHHRDLPDGYWDGLAALKSVGESPNQTSPVGARFREYVRVAEYGSLRDDQNRSVGGWVNPGSRFRVEIDIVNVSKVELGALLWLFRLPDDCYFRLGGCKPLGFGSVRISLAGLDLADGAAIRKDLRSILPQLDHEVTDLRLSHLDQADAIIDRYRAKMEKVYGGAESFPDIKLIKAFLNGARGFADGKPIHYPRAAPADWDGKAAVAPNPEGKNYEWFVENDRSSKFGAGPRQALDPLWAPAGLTMLKVDDDTTRDRFGRSGPRGNPQARPGVRGPHGSRR